VREGSNDQMCAGLAVRDSRLYNSLSHAVCSGRVECCDASSSADRRARPIVPPDVPVKGET
jgi:hypothetical protein